MIKNTFKIEYKTVWGESLHLLAGGKRFPMDWGEGDIWSVTLSGEDATSASEERTYEVVRDQIVVRQEWDNHIGTQGQQTVIDWWIDVPEGCVFLKRHSNPAFDSKGFRGAGTAVPVFSLRSEDDFGVGEFYDLKKLVDWAAQTGQKVIQLLPVNDTTMSGTWEDSYPYNAATSFALHPQYLNLPAAGVRRTPAYKNLQAELNALPKIDYVRVNAEKSRLLHRLFERTGAQVMDTPAYRRFYIENIGWLEPYAVYCALRDENGTADFTNWKKYSEYSAEKARRYHKENAAAVDYHCFVQFLLDKQFREVRDYARSKGVAFKGDLPIGVSRTSCDAWCHPELFNLDSQAGAPPDAFAADGQNWGFPTYNWDEMAKDDYAWWRARLGKMSEYFDAFRIDHILGFFRIWEIPVPEKSGLRGHFSPALPYTAEEIGRSGLPRDLFLEDPRRPGYYHPRISVQNTDEYAALPDWQKRSFNGLYDDFFYRRHNSFWKQSALRKIPALLGSTGMLACGEDLGMIPACVPEVMDSQKILSLEIQRMPKDPSVEFGDPAKYPYMCVCTTSTHDMSPLRAWWEEEDRGLIQRYYNTMLGREGEAPAAASPEICEQIVKQHLASPAMLTILPLQDWIAMEGSLCHPRPAEERINVPAICPYYWRYRMHLTLEELLSQTSFNNRIGDLVRESGR